METFKKENMIEFVARAIGTTIEAQIVRVHDSKSQKAICSFICGESAVRRMLPVMDISEFLYVKLKNKKSRPERRFAIFQRPENSSSVIFKMLGGMTLEDYTREQKIKISVENIPVKKFEKKYWEYENAPTKNGIKKEPSIYIILGNFFPHGRLFSTPTPRDEYDDVIFATDKIEAFDQLTYEKDDKFVIHKNKNLYHLYTLGELTESELYKLVWAPASTSDNLLENAIRAGEIKFEDVCVNQKQYNKNIYQKYVFHTLVTKDKYGNTVKRGCSFEKCSECGKVYFPSQELDKVREEFGGTPMVSREKICSDCIIKKYFVCDVCGHLRLREEEYKTNEMDTRCCMACWGARPIHRYFYNPKFKHIDPEKIYYGIELEVEGNVNIVSKASKLIAKYPKVYLKSDSSIRNGFEIVTVPLDNFYEPWTKSMLSDLRRGGFRSFQTDTCGMHVHVSSEPLTERNIRWLTEFFYQKSNSGFLRLMSERDVRMLIRWANLDKTGVGLLDSSDIIARQKKERGVVSHERHSILNLTKEHTIEFRMFRGTLKYESFIGNLEFVKSLIDSSEYIAPSYDMLVDYIGAQHEKYPHLITKLQRLKIIDSELRMGRTIPPIIAEPTVSEGNTTRVFSREDEGTISDYIREMRRRAIHSGTHNFHAELTGDMGEDSATDSTAPLYVSFSEDINEGNLY